VSHLATKAAATITVHRHTDEALHANFQRALLRALKGKRVPPENPFSGRLVDALDEIASAYPRCDT
jgi:hypothetical protein